MADTAEEKKSWAESGFDASIPIWDGKGDSLREYKRTVRWWLSSIDLEKTKYFNLAARFAMRQKGSAKLCALEFDPKDLEYKPAVTVPDVETGEEIEASPVDYTYGVWKIIDAWENMVGRTVTDKRGELRERFYLTLKRPPTESVTAFALRYRTLVAEMKADGILIDDKEQAWFYKTKLGLTEMQKQMLETTLGSSSEDYAACERESIRLFKRVHAGSMPMGHRKPMSLGSFTQRRDHRFPFKKFSSGASSASSTTSSWSRRTPSRSVNVTEQDEQWHAEEGEEEGEEHETYEAENEEEPDDEALLYLQDEVECFAAELEDLHAQGLEEGDLAELEEQLDGAVEALVTMKEAKQQIASLRKDRGYHGGAGAGGSSVDEKKKVGKCWDCHQTGHWAGDPACPKGRGKGGKGKSKGGKPGRGFSRFKGGKGKGKSESHVAENEANTVDLIGDFQVPCSRWSEVMFSEKVDVHEINEVNMIENDLEPAENEVMVVSSGLAEALAAATTKAPQTLDYDKLYQAAMDSACNRSCAGREWIKTMLDALKFAPAWIQRLVSKVEETERFRFGNGGTLVSTVRHRIPVVLMNKVVLVWINEIPCDTLGCLLGKDFMESLGSVVDFLNKRMMLQLLDDQRWLPLHRMKAGHFSVNLLPKMLEKWPSLGSEDWVRTGVGGVCEVQAKGRYKLMLGRLKHNPQEARVVETYVVSHYLPEDLCESKSTNSGDGRARGARHKFDRGMDPHGFADEAPCPVELQGSVAMDDPAARVALGAIPTSSGGRRGELEEAVRPNGDAAVMAEIMVAEGHAESEVHVAEPEGRSSSSRPAGHAHEFLGGQPHHGGSHDPQAKAQEDDRECFVSRAEEVDQHDGDGSAEASGRAGGSPRRLAQSQGRIARALRPAEHRGGQRRHGGEAEGEVAANDGHAEGQQDGCSSTSRKSRKSKSEGHQSSSSSPKSSSRRRNVKPRSEDGRAVLPASGDSAANPGSPGGIGSKEGGLSPSRSSRSAGSASGGDELLRRERRPDALHPDVRDRSLGREDGVGKPDDGDGRPPDGGLGADPAGGAGVLQPGRREPVSELAKLIGSVGNSKIYSRLKPGMRQIISQAAKKALRLERALTVRSQHANDILMAEVEEEHVQEILNPQILVTEIHLVEDEVSVKKKKMMKENVNYLRRDESRTNDKSIDRWLAGQRGDMKDWVVRKHDQWRKRLFDPRDECRGGPSEEENYTGRRITRIRGKNGQITERDEAFEDNFLSDAERRPTPRYTWIGETMLEVMSESGYGQWDFNKFPPEVKANAKNKGHYVLSNGDELAVYTRIRFMPDSPVPKGGVNIPVSTFHCNPQGHWTVLEQGVPWSQRMLPWRCSEFADEAMYFVRVYHNEAVDEQPLVSEHFTDTEPVSREAARRGHRVGTTMTLPEYDFYKAEDREEAIRTVCIEQPFGIILAFPCTVWSPLQNLTLSKMKGGAYANRLKRRRLRDRVLIRHVVRMALLQMARGRHFVIENPSRSAAWHLCRELRNLRMDPRVNEVVFDQCRFGLRGPWGRFHQKRTMILTSSIEVINRLTDKMCQKDHDHEYVLGGHEVTSKAGHYPKALAKAIVDGLQEEARLGQLRNEANVAEGEENEEEDGSDDEAEGDEESGDEDPENPRGDPHVRAPGDGGNPPLQPGRARGDDQRGAPRDDLDEDDTIEEARGAQKPSREQRMAVMRLHCNTGHRDPKRLARALIMAGAAPEVVRAARELRCEVCHENQRPKAHRPASLPQARHFGDQVHMDLFHFKDAVEEKFWVVHAVDAASQFQVARVLEAKSADAVVKFLNEGWISILGTPKTLVVDSGPEFIAEKFQAACDFHDITLHHVAVEAPWANGIAERGGQALKTICRALSVQFTPHGRADMSMVLSAALEAVNGDIGESGYSPQQFVLGKQPRLAGMVIPSGLRDRLAAHSLIENSPSMERQIAMKEMARVSMVRLKYSRSLRRAELARARKPVLAREYETGELV